MQNQQFPMSQFETLKLELPIIHEELASTFVRLASATMPAYSSDNRFVLEDESGGLYYFSDTRTQIGDTDSFRILVRAMLTQIARS